MRVLFWGLSIVAVTSLVGCKIEFKALQEAALKSQARSVSASLQGSNTLQLLAATNTLGIGQQLAMNATGGKPPYTFSSTGGTMTQAGSFRAPYTPSTVTVRVQDSGGTLAESRINVIVGTTRIPNDSMYSRLAYLNSTSNLDINAPEAWAITTDCSQTLVAVVDSGVDYDHPDLASNIYANTREVEGRSGVDDDGNGRIDDVRGWDFYEGDNTPKDLLFHGTHVAGLIGALGNNSVGVTGVCWTAKIMPVRVLDAEGGGFESDVIDGIDYSVRSGAKIINMSLGGPAVSSHYEDVVNSTTSRGVLIIAAAGNDGLNVDDGNPLYPASLRAENIIGVAALCNSASCRNGSTETAPLAEFSNYGATSIDIAAPGKGILSTFPGILSENGAPVYGTLDGTSMATPLVSGVAALLWSFEPALSASEVKRRILDRSDTVDALRNRVVGNRRLNARKVLYAQ